MEDIHTTNQHESFEFLTQNIRAVNYGLYRQFYLSYKILFLPVKDYFIQLPSIGQSPVANLETIDIQNREIWQSPIAKLENKECFVSEQILFDRLSYTHFVQLLPLENALKQGKNVFWWITIITFMICCFITVFFIVE